VTDSSTPQGLPVVTTGLVHVYRSEGHDVAALSGVDLHVPAGSILALIGPSGAGKSTLLTLLGGLLQPSAGKIHVGPFHLESMTPDQLYAYRALEIGLILQGASRNLLPYLTPRRNVEFAQARAKAAHRPVPSAADVLSLCGLLDHADTPLAKLTPGQRQLAALAAAISTRPGLLLADEPTSQLDHHARDLVLGTIDHISQEYGTTVVIVTHDPNVASQLPRTVTIRDGRIGAEGRAGRQFAVVAADGSLALPAAVLQYLPPGTLVSVDLDRTDGTDRWTLTREDPEGTG